ncbi:MAG: hypothetical protein RLY20_891 [Verrucomicrobiota bacterium]|jgi:hypothetical protein
MSEQDQTPPTPTPPDERAQQAAGCLDIIAELYRKDGSERIAENVEMGASALRSHVALVEALEEILEALRVDAPGTPLNNHKYDALGIKARAALSHAKARP